MKKFYVKYGFRSHDGWFDRYTRTAYFETREEAEAWKLEQEGPGPEVGYVKVSRVMEVKDRA